MATASKPVRITTTTGTTKRAVTAHTKALNLGRALLAIRDSQKALAEAEAAVQKSVNKARRHGATWAEVGDMLGVTRQSACQRFGGKP